MIRRLLLTTAVLALAACGAPEPAPTEAPAPVPEAPVPPAAGVLTSDGLPPLRVGMTLAEVTAAAGPDSDPEAVGGADPASCDEFRPERSPPGTLVMVENGVLTRIGLIRDSAVKTDRGFGIGDTAATIKAAYGPAAEVTPHKYVAAPAEYIAVWASADRTSPAARGIIYEIAADGRVQAVRAGGPSIAYVEGCA